MERGEPTLVPEWLRSTGGGLSGGGGGSGHLFASSSAHSDSSSSSRGKNRNSMCISSSDSPRSAYLDQSSSSNLRGNSSNGSAKNVYSSFSRGRRDRDWDRDKDRLKFGGDPWDCDSSDPLGSILTNHGERDTQWHTHSMVKRKQGEALAHKVGVDLKNGSGSNHANGNGLIPWGMLPKVVLDKDFPSLGGEERKGMPDVIRVSSPRLSSTAQSWPVGSSSLLSGEGWTSALIEVPNTIGCDSSGSLSGMQAATAATSGTSIAMAGLNMAEALTLAPTRTHVSPQLSVQVQRREELAIKQLRQLIPVTPSMTKGSVLNSSEKLKPKSLVRSGEVTTASKNVQQLSAISHPVSQTLPVGIIADAMNTPQGKLFVLKLGLENGVSQSLKDVASPTSNSISRTTNGQLAAPSVPSMALRSPSNPKPSSGERKPSVLTLMKGYSLEKKPSLSQTQSRNDFFNHLKKKNSESASAAPTESIAVASSPASAASGNCPELHKDGVIAPASFQAGKECADPTANGDSREEVHGFSEEEEAFLRRLGWEENSGEEEGLTEEEISAFIEECMKLKPSVKLCSGLQQRLLESRSNSMSAVSSELSSSDACLEA